MHTVKVISSDQNEALLERVDGAVPGQYVISRYRTKLSIEEFVQEYLVGKQFETDVTKIPIRVYAVETSEPYYQRFETGLADGLGLYFDRNAAQEAADEMHEEFPEDEELPYVVRLEVW
jgi:hypothetical protein